MNDNPGYTNVQFVNYKVTKTYNYFQVALIQAWIVTQSVKKNDWDFPGLIC